ncbi:MAG: hypothetical protein MR629_02755 [Helicobacter sp.]|uniref:hypothetical protein n=1 Tax=Helicobacter sp. 10-6591 TaxID=2004998 RepID=UPI000DCE0EF1|nr:hypothetical protein [Helicobacter sp. 10-6591]MCI6217444.1 hypothetical protein [Helicobacter sp.]MCI7484800.1 hypothetical protein [Helicobacter sp.]MDD7566848.1 hypothetical protein [Helicobacter sp.]MDY5740183.1 hypothetical protein [Helicobacter sp.]RAX55835.1 hypothetical protein CCY97_02755 [Helicobacter sp. 10-6591]
MSEAVSQSLNDLVFYHKFFAFLFIVPIVCNLWNLYFHKNLVSLNKKIWFCMPLVFFLVAVAILSGLNILFFNFESFSFSVVSMIGLCVYILITEILRIRKLKVAKRTDLEAMKSYVNFCKIVYFTQAILFCLVVSMR